MSLDSIQMATFYYGTAVIFGIGVLLTLIAIVLCRAEVERQPRAAQRRQAQVIVLPKRRAAMFSHGRRVAHRAG